MRVPHRVQLLRVLIVLALALALGPAAGLLSRAATGRAAHDAPAAQPHCAAYADTATAAGRVPKELSELSGLAASRRHPGIFWAHNDSGNAFRLFALTSDGTIRASFPLGGAKPRDVEDVAVGPCARGAQRSCIFLADTGDNLLRRPDARIFKVAEPDLLDGRSLEVETLPFQYPDGPRNVESIVAEAGTGRLFVISKTFASLGEVYRLDDLGVGRRGRAMLVGSLESPGSGARVTTGADAHPDGERLILRTYSSVWELRRPGAGRLEEVFAAKPIRITAPPQAQSEAVAYSSDGRAYLLGTEGAGRLIYQVGCRADP